MKHYAEIKLNGQTYEVHLFAEAEPQVFVVKTMQARSYGTDRTYRQRITSAPKIKRLVKLALAQA